MGGIKVTAELAKTVNEFLGVTFLSQTDIGKTLVDKVNGTKQTPATSRLAAKGDGIIGIAYEGAGTGYEKILQFRRSAWSGTYAEIDGYFCANDWVRCKSERQITYAEIDTEKAALLVGALFGFDALPQQALSEIEDPAAIESALALFEKITAKPDPKVDTNAKGPSCP
ncbi:MAG: hypothetical protein HY696_04510 [Deltaproteobacteria bacterium]|nr:hypothetical protein [Deltaproteobacteria bacterium]